MKKNTQRLFSQKNPFYASADYQLPEISFFIEFNQFHVTSLSLYPQKTSENLWFSNVFRGYRQRSLQWILTNFIDKKVTEHIFDEKLFHLMLVREKHCDNRLKIKWIIEKKNFKINEKLFKKFSVVIKKKNLEIFLKQSPRGVL